MATAYEIQNLENGNVYIGSTTQTKQTRKNRHWSDLRAGRHHNDHLQRAWNIYGEDAFKFVPMLELDCSEKEIRDIETQLIHKARLALGFENVYTVLDGTESPMSNPEVRAKVAEAVRSAEVREKLSVASRAAWEDDDYRERVADGVRRSWEDDDVRARRIAGSVKTFVFRSPGGERVVVTNLNAFCRENGLNVGNMSSVHSGRLYQHKGWTTDN